MTAACELAGEGRCRGDVVRVDCEGCGRAFARCARHALGDPRWAVGLLLKAHRATCWSAFNVEAEQLRKRGDRKLREARAAAAATGTENPSSGTGGGSRCGSSGGGAMRSHGADRAAGEAPAGADVVTPAPTWRARPKRTRPRPRSIPDKKLTRAERLVGAELAHPEDAVRPRCRAECADVPRPCPWVSCHYHLYLDVDPRSGSLKLNFPDLEPDQLAESCVLDVADAGGATLERTGEILNLTRERIRQIELRGLLALRELAREDAGDRPAVQTSATEAA